MKDANQNQSIGKPVTGKIDDGKHASAFSSCGNVRKTAVRPGGKTNPVEKRR